MRSSMAYFAGAGTVIAAVVAGLGGGYLFFSIVSPHPEKHGSSEVSRLERRMSTDPIPATNKGAPEPVPYLDKPQISAAVADPPSQPQQRTSAAAARRQRKPQPQQAQPQPRATGIDAARRAAPSRRRLLPRRSPLPPPNSPPRAKNPRRKIPSPRRATPISGGTRAATDDKRKAERTAPAMVRTAQMASARR